MDLVQSVKAVEKAVEEHDPVKVFVAFSGGRDSAVTLDLAYRMSKKMGIIPENKFAVMSIITGLQADGWANWVVDYVKTIYGMEVEFYTGLGRHWFAENTKKQGFGYTPSLHTLYYRSLKERAIEAALRENKEGRYSRVLFLTGVRRAESAKRKNRDFIWRKGSRVSVNMIAHFSDEDRDNYHKALLPFYDNPFYDLYGSSGDCFCGWTCNNTVDEFAQESPDLHKFLSELEQEVVSCGMWRYGSTPDKDNVFARETAGEEMPEDALCISCGIAARQQGALKQGLSEEVSEETA